MGRRESKLMDFVEKKTLGFVDDNYYYYLDFFVFACKKKKLLTCIN